MRSWVAACCLGWVLGVPAIALLALVGESIGVGGSQALVGLGMGSAVGWVQGGRLTGLGISRAAWFWSSALGIGAPFIAWDVAQHLALPLEYSLLRLLLVGGVVTGGVQGWLLAASRLDARIPAARASRGSILTWWIAVCAVGWAAAGWCAGLADELIKTHAVRGLAGAGLYLASVAVGGPVLGLVTAPVLRRRLGTGLR